MLQRKTVSKRQLSNRTSATLRKITDLRNFLHQYYAPLRTSVTPYAAYGVSFFDTHPYAPLLVLRTYYAPITHLLPYYEPVTRLLRAYYALHVLRRCYEGCYAGVTEVTQLLRRLRRCYGSYAGVTEVLRRCYGGYAGVTEFHFLLRRCLRRSVTTRNFDV